MMAAIGDFRSLSSQIAPIVVPVGLGMIALGLLLPRPRRTAILPGIAAGVLALVLAGVLLLRVAAIGVESVLFYAFTALALIHGGIMITQANPARAALAFAMVVLSSCGLFLLNAAPFLMAGTIIIYAGAIVVTFLFVLMLAQPDGMSDADRRSREPALAVLAGFFLLSTMLFVVRQTYGMYDYESWLADIAAAREDPARVWDIVAPPGERKKADARFADRSSDLVHRVLGREESLALIRLIWQKDEIDGISEPSEKNLPQIRDWLNRLHEAAETYRAQSGRTVGRLRPPAKLELSSFAGPPANAPPSPNRAGEHRESISADNVGGLGRTLFTDYLLAVELGGTLLLVATVGAIAITRPRSAARRSA